MLSHAARPTGVLALLPFMVQGALSLAVFRAMIDRGMSLAVAYYIRDGGGYTEDVAEDLRTADRLIDLSGFVGDGVEELDAVVRDWDLGMIIQVGAPAAYAQLPYLKERHPSLRVIDVLYNKVGHTLNHFLFEACFDGVIVESEDMLRYVLENSAKADPRVRIVPNGVDLDAFVMLPIARRSRDGGLAIGYVGRMSPEKNPLGFVELAERLHERLPSLVFRMYGDGFMADQVNARVAASPIGDGISYEGYAARPVEALAQIDVLIVPSVLDGRPNIIMEASSCGVPTIGAPVGAIPELIEPGRNGYVLGPSETDAIAGVLSGWIDDEPALQRIRMSSREMAQARFDRRLMLDRYESVIREFLVGTP